MLFPYRDETPSASFPFITLVLIAINATLFILLPKMGGLEAIADKFGFTARLMIDKPYVLLSSILLHASLWHLVSNMWFLWLFGDNIEDRFGRMPYLVLFILAGVAGNFTHAIFSLFQSNVPVIGASGAVAGIMGAYLIRFPNAKIRCVFLIIFYPIFIKIRAIWFIGFWMVLEFFSAILGTSSHVAHWAHIGGFIFGAVWAFGRRDKAPFPRGAWGRRH
ncbi:rhomboid family intramembrane serine protease [bacterium]|nr:rhomboid family intramembrane serine protease [bacterium]